MLNLLPPEIKSRHKVRSRLFSVTVFYIIVAAVFVLGPIAAITYNFIQASQVADVESEINQIKSRIGQSKDINNKLSFVENRVTGASQFQEQRDWNEYLAVISSAIPAPVLVSTIRLEAKTDTETSDVPTFTVSGTSGDRRSIILYRDKLLEDELINQTTFTTLTEVLVDGSKSFSFVLSVVFIK